MAARKWSQEQRLAQSKAIRQHQPWLSSTSAKSDVGKLNSSQNAFRGGHRPLIRELAKALKEQGAFICDFDSRQAKLKMPIGINDIAG